ncbi:hypothetical protein P3X46_029557 [Hevea brasiliensis]|uniref:Protein GAMETE EXPRESSED 3 n=2 Tax=Hevea brasiliensis TaxID=3981 RepID=A0ABQ9KTS9_HEVBR|nr:protein GAMETE EXPRESSED 3 [Hevea brasiliensis]KAJ9147387.1 hypothetical protein P3X46_029557 [Hevea brasiliensis]
MMIKQTLEFSFRKRISKMPIQLLLFLPLITASASTAFHNLPGQGTSTRATCRLSKPLIGEDDGRIYTCCERNFFAFESNGSIAWTLHLAYTCNVSLSPIHGGRGKIFLVAENRVLKIIFHDVGTSPPMAEVFFGQEDAGEIIGLAVNTLSSSVFINVRNRGLFAFTIPGQGQLLWSVGPVISQFGYRLGCRNGVTDCYFNSVPVIDQCEASIYISNTAGELYSLSFRSPRFNWVQDLSSFDKDFTVTPGNNAHLYVTVPIKALVLALDVSMGNILWQTSIGPLNAAEFAPVVDSQGWISIGSLDGFLYSISPTGDVKKFAKASVLNHVIQVSPFLDCSGYAVYISQAEMEGKVSQVIGEYNYVSALRPRGVVFTLLVPATGAVYWSEIYPGQFSSLLSQSDLQDFVLDEGILLAFITASRTGNPLPCRSKHEKLLSTCSQARPKHVRIYTGDEKTIMLFLLFESIALVVLAGLVRFCCVFWSKKKIQGQGLGDFLEKRRSLQLKKKAFDRTITELKQKAAEEAVANEVIEELGDLVRERQGIERKLSTTYSLGRDGNGQQSKSLLPVHDGKTTRSYSFQSAKKESVTIFHTLSDTTSSGESSSERGYSRWISAQQDNQSAAKTKAKAKAQAPIEAESSSDDGSFIKDFQSSSEPASCKEAMEWYDEGNVGESTQTGGRCIWLKRRTLSSTN